MVSTRTASPAVATRTLGGAGANNSFSRAAIATESGASPKTSNHASATSTMRASGISRATSGPPRGTVIGSSSSPAARRVAVEHSLITPTIHPSVTSMTVPSSAAPVMSTHRY